MVVGSICVDTELAIGQCTTYILKYEGNTTGWLKKMDGKVIPLCQEDHLFTQLKAVKTIINENPSLLLSSSCCDTMNTNVYTYSLYKRPFVLPKFVQAEKYTRCLLAARAN